MPLVEWKAEFSVGFERLDGEHRHLISLLNQLHIAQAERREISILGAILRELVWYSQWHFRAEEVLMETYAYPDLASHKAEHDRFRSQITQFVDRSRSGRDAIAVELSDSLQEWLMRHTLECDAEYARFFQSNGITETVNASVSPYASRIGRARLSLPSV
jgi:hemerythrin